MKKETSLLLIGLGTICAIVLLGITLVSSVVFSLNLETHSLLDRSLYLFLLGGFAIFFSVAIFLDALGSVNLQLKHVLYTILLTFLSWLMQNLSANLAVLACVVIVATNLPNRSLYFILSTLLFVSMGGYSLFNLYADLGAQLSSE